MAVRKILNPYRAGSSYNVLWGILYNNRIKGIRKNVVIKQAGRIIKTSEARIGYSLNVVISPTLQEDGTTTFHKSCNSSTRKLPHYFLRNNGLIKMVVR